MAQDILAVPLLPVGLAALGLIFGSFTTALSYRLPRGESVARGRSRCPACGHALAARDLVPVLSWISQGGACRYCGVKIPARYPAIEGLSAALFVAAGFLAQNDAALLLLLAMTPVMVALAVIDIEHRRLPNSPVVILALLALAWRQTQDGDVLTGLVTAAVAVAACLMLSAAMRAMSRQPGLGMGDTKLFAVAGMALPVGIFLLFATLAGILGIGAGLFARRRAASAEFSFGPVILAALWTGLAVGEGMMNQLLTFRLG